MDIKKIVICVAACFSVLAVGACGKSQPKVATVEEFAEIAQSQGFGVNTTKIDPDYLLEGDPVEEAYAYKQDMDIHFDIFADENYAQKRYTDWSGIIDDAHKKNSIYVTESDSGAYDGSVRVVLDGTIVVFYNISDNCKDKEAARVEMKNLANGIGY